jgi:hypothetical protein
MDGQGVTDRLVFRLREKIHLLGWNEVILRFQAVQRTALQAFRSRQTGRRVP